MSQVALGLTTVGLLVVSNAFMTLAWYGHLKLQDMGVTSNWPLYGVILLSWGIALLEYCFQVPANRLGFVGNGGPFTLMQLKVIQEAVALTVFAPFAVLVMNQPLKWDYLWSALCLIGAVYFAFR